MNGYNPNQSYLWQPYNNFTYGPQLATNGSVCFPPQMCWPQIQHPSFDNRQFNIGPYNDHNMLRPRDVGMTDRVKESSAALDLVSLQSATTTSTGSSNTSTSFPAPSHYARKRADIKTGTEIDDEDFNMDGGSSRDRYHECPFPQCEYKTARMSNMKAHIRHHTGDRPYKCSFPGCNFGSAQSSNLRVHERIHTGDRPYKCDIPGCVYGATHLNLLPSHKRKAHGIGSKIRQRHIRTRSSTRSSIATNTSEASDDRDAMDNEQHPETEFVTATEEREADNITMKSNQEDEQDERQEKLEVICDRQDSV